MAAGTNDTFKIGLTMAGAISAGAYSAGVFDFLVEALECWEKARTDPSPKAVPTHKVAIVAMSGASAGSITAALGVVAAATATAPKKMQPPITGKNPHIAYLRPLYEAWVDKPQFSTRSGKCLFGVDDLKGPGRVVSLLDSSVLDEIAEAAIAGAKGKNISAKPYLPLELPIYMTLANLRGVPYGIEFTTGAGTAVPFAGYGMMMHADRAMFRIDGIGTYPGPKRDSFADDPSAEVLSVKKLNDGAETKEWLAFAKTSLASSAFPVGLAPRIVEAASKSYEIRKWPLPSEKLFKGEAKLAPRWPAAQSGRYEFVDVDGGVFNNEPFEYARFALMDNPPAANKRDATDADRAVIMIDPFPEPPEFQAQFAPGDAVLVAAIKRLFPAMINQARFKPEDLLAAADAGVFSRFLIAPKRDGETYAIACGLLGGFGGFLEWDFRAHDYQLGRRNCQKFLRDIFAVGKTNPIVAGGPQVFTGDQAHAVLIPLFGSARLDVVLPEWPRVSRDVLLDAVRRALARADELVPRLLETETSLSGPIRFAIRTWWRLSGRKKLQRYVYQTIQADLLRRDQLAYEGLYAGLANLSDTQRAILAAACATDEKPMRLAKIVERCGLDQGTVEKALRDSDYVPVSEIAGETRYLFGVLAGH